MSTNAFQDATVADLPFFDVHVRDGTIGADVARILERNPSLPGVLVIGDSGLRGVVSRNQFFQRLGRLFGIEIYSTRPITAYLDSMSSAPIILPHHTTIQSAAIVCLARTTENVYDPFVVLLADGMPRLVDFLALILKQTELLASAQAEAQAQKSAAIDASNAKSKFLANMSHELRTPLTAIIGYSEILLEDFTAGEHGEALPRIRNIHGAGLHLLEMINSILDLSKVEAGKIDVLLGSFSLTAFLHEITGTLTPLMQKNNNEFSVICEPGLGDMHSDEMKVRQSLLNLLGNAAKFTRNGRIMLHVTRESSASGDWAVFRVSDTGIGMSEVQMQRLFEAFYQADSSISRRYGGTGLGLNLSKRFCEMLGGSLSVESVLDQGTTFTMRLPFCSQAPPETPALSGET